MGKYLIYLTKWGQVHRYEDIHANLQLTRMERCSLSPVSVSLVGRWERLHQRLPHGPVSARRQAVRDRRRHKRNTPARHWKSLELHVQINGAGRRNVHLRLNQRFACSHTGPRMLFLLVGGWINVVWHFGPYMTSLWRSCRLSDDKEEPTVMLAWSGLDSMLFYLITQITTEMPKKQ